MWQRQGLNLLAGIAVGSLLLATPSDAQTETVAPTARYAQGEAVDLALIIGEWKARYPNIPVFACVCDAETCDLTARWPFRTYQRYQFSVTLGPFNAGYAEEKNFNCFDIQTGQRPSNAGSNSPEPDTPDTPETDQGQGSLEIPTATALEAGTVLRLAWENGQTNAIDITGWNINLLNALDCNTLSIVPEKSFTARRILGMPVVDADTGAVAVPVLLDECVETQQSAVFVVDPQGVESYALYRVQVPGPQMLPNEFSSYPLNSINGLQYWDSTLLVRQGSASGAEALLVLRPGSTPAGTYAGCAFLNAEEGGDRLCPQE